MTSDLYNKANVSYVYKSSKGLNRARVLEIAEQKNEPGWMIDFRLRALELFEQKPMPNWGADLSALDPYDIYYYIKPTEKKYSSWDDVPEQIKKTFDALGIPQAERAMLAGVGAQFESELVYKKLREDLQEQGVIFSDISQALQTHPELVKNYFATIVPPHDNKFAALNSAVWSGGSFVYVPAGVYIDMPLQAYFRINEAQMGQFERTLIIAEPGSFVHYVEGCSAPMYSNNSLHSAVVEIAVLAGAHVRYTTIQNWAPNVYNLVTKRAVAYRGAKMEWVDGNFGSKVTMKYPSIILKEPEARGEIISIAVAGKNQHQDAGGKIIHLAPNTTSNIISKSLSKDGGRASYRGLLKIIQGAHGSRATVQCEALLFDEYSRSDTYPTNDIRETDVSVGHEASVSTLSDDDLFYLMSRGLSQAQAQAMIVNGFIDAFVQLLPMEYALEINRLIELEMEGSIG
ncbi:MAG: Fe-S cluster assembly protein SufB [Candidatus Babeliales bacterium]